MPSRPQSRGRWQPRSKRYSGSQGDKRFVSVRRQEDMAKDNTDREKALVSDIQTKLKTGKPSEAFLETDERVLARITDGIYRQPSSALRELIANAYDADAENVYIQTDCPRFQQIRVRDDGHGLSIKALSNL